MAIDEHTADGTTPLLVIGAGPAGLTAAWAAVDRGIAPVVLEPEDLVGGIACTVERDGWRFDIGGHRFFTRVDEVDRLWRAMLDEGDWLTRPRSSRILYDGRLFDYPLRFGNVLRRLGPFEAMRCVGSYLWARIRPPRDQSHFEGWVTARFGRRLYDMFFRTYTEKVWGVDPRLIQADWAAQRIRNLSLSRAVLDSLPLRRRSATHDVTSLITEFRYPRLGPGMLWERCRDRVVAAGGAVLHGYRVTGLVRRDDDRIDVRAQRRDGSVRTWIADDVVSSMPLGSLVQAISPMAPDGILDDARSLRHRDFLTVALTVPGAVPFDDQWIYVHSPGVRVGRIQNFAAWSPELVPGPGTCLGLEYFVSEGDELWSSSDDDLVALATRELAELGLVDESLVGSGYVVRMPKAYPVYDAGYDDRVGRIADWLAAEHPHVHPVGRNGMHKYNNQDHSMLTALHTVENILDGADHDVWSVNVDDEYHERRSAPTGRDAPVLPSPVGPDVPVAGS